MEKAAEQGNCLAKFELWKQKAKCNNDPAVKIQELRELREICLEGNEEAELELAMNYASGNIGNLNREMAAETVRQVSSELTIMFSFLCLVHVHIYIYILFSFVFYAKISMESKVPDKQSSKRRLLKALGKEIRACAKKTA